MRWFPSCTWTSSRKGLGGGFQRRSGTRFDQDEKPDIVGSKSPEHTVNNGYHLIILRGVVDLSRMLSERSGGVSVTARKFRGRVAYCWPNYVHAYIMIVIVIVIVIIFINHIIIIIIIINIIIIIILLFLHLIIILVSLLSLLLLVVVIAVVVVVVVVDVVVVVVLLIVVVLVPVVVVVVLVLVHLRNRAQESSERKSVPPFPPLPNVGKMDLRSSHDSQH